MALTSEDISKIADLLRPLEQHIDGLEGKTGGLNGKVDGLDSKIGDLNGKVDGLEGKMGGLNGKVDGLERKFDHDFAELRQQISGIEMVVNTQFNEVQNNFDALLARDEKREEEYVVIRMQIARLEERVQILETKVVKSL